MNCIAEEALVEIALGQSPPPPHLDQCPNCQARLASWRQRLDQLADAHRRLDAGHAEARAQLMAKVASEQAVRPRAWPLPGRRAIGVYAAAAVLLLGVGVLWFALSQPSALAQASRAMQAAGGFTCTISEWTGDAAKPTIVGQAAFDGQASRLDSLIDGQISEYAIYLPGKPGIHVRHGVRDFRRVSADRQPNPGLAALAGLARFEGNPERTLGRQTIADRAADGYELALAAVLPDAPADARLEVWLDIATRLPVRVDITGVLPGRRLRLDAFTWGPIEPRRFDTTPPPGYFEVQVKPLPEEERIARIVYALRTFAKYNQGQYPRAKIIFADQQAEELRRHMGLGQEATPFVWPDAGTQFENPQHEEFARATHGLTLIHEIQRHNGDAAYHGMSVTSADAGKVLLRWRLADGQYRVIYGDLQTATLPGAALRQLEGQ